VGRRSQSRRAGRADGAGRRAREGLPRPPARSQATLEAERHWDDLESLEWSDKSVLAHAYLLAGRWQEAQQLAACENVLGWSGSGNPQGLVMPFFLVRLARKSPTALPGNPAQLLSWCIDVAKRRVEAIVGRQRRGSYDEAADALVEDIRNRFPRHRAFQAELDTALEHVKRSRRRR
jgi:hypothetical protein